MLVNKWLKTFYKALREETQAVLTEAQARISSYHHFFEILYQSLQEYCVRGIGLGAALTLAVARGLSKEGEWKAGLRVAVIVDLFSKGILILDDIIDEDEQRMGADAFHTISSKYAEEQGWSNPKRFGSFVGILTSSIVRNLGQLALLSTSIPHTTYRAIEAQLIEMQNNIDHSQLLDLYFENIFPTVEQWEAMAKKRGAAHVEAAIKVGGLLNNWSDQDANLLGKAGIQIGYVYDIRADLMDSFGTQTNRRVIHRDFKMKKKPLFFCMAYKNAPAEERRFLKEQIEKSPHLLKNHLPLFEKYGLAESLQQQQKFGHSAIALIKNSSLNSDAKIFFEQLITRALSFPNIPKLQKYA